MVKEFDICKIDEVMQIWLDTNIAAHDFIPKEYWTDNYEIVKTMLPNADILIYEEDEIKGFIGIVDKTYIAGLLRAYSALYKDVGTVNTDNDY